MKAPKAFQPIQASTPVPVGFESFTKPRHNGQSYLGISGYVWLLMEPTSWEALASPATLARALRQSLCVDLEWMPHMLFPGFQAFDRSTTEALFGVLWFPFSQILTHLLESLKPI